VARLRLIPQRSRRSPRSRSNSGAPITTEEFHILNRCLDTAIAESVTEHGRISSESRRSEEVERLGRLAHEIRDMLSAALMALDIVKRGTVSINGSTGAVLARSLIGIQNLVDTTLTDVRLSANHQRRERVAITALLDEIAVAARLDADHRGQRRSLSAVWRTPRQGPDRHGAGPRHRSASRASARR